MRKMSGLNTGNNAIVSYQYLIMKYVCFVSVRKVSCHFFRVESYEVLYTTTKMTFCPRKIFLFHRTLKRCNRGEFSCLNSTPCAPDVGQKIQWSKLTSKPYDSTCCVFRTVRRQRVQNTWKLRLICRFVHKYHPILLLLNIRPDIWHNFDFFWPDSISGTLN